MGVAVKMAKMTWQVGLAIFPASGYSSQRPHIKMDRLIGHRDLGPWPGHFLTVGDPQTHILFTIIRSAIKAFGSSKRE